MTATATTYYYNRVYEISDDQATTIQALRERHGAVRFLGRLYRSTDCRVSVGLGDGRHYFDIDHLGGIREAGR